MCAAINPKSAAWDSVGKSFWELGRKTARPSDNEIALFLQDVGPDTRCLIVGASTIDLINSAIDRGAAVTVFDFSERMCSDLQYALAGRPCEIRHWDITQLPPADWQRRFRFVLSDRLINRFTADEAATALRAMLALVESAGEIRLSVKLGFYPMDLAMIEQGRLRGTLAKFFDPRDRTIDFNAAGTVLEDALVAHGEIPREVLLSWYRGRGRESRYEHEDIMHMLPLVNVQGRTLRLVAALELPNAPNSMLYKVGSAETA